jgi:hypothetical protein
VEQDAALLLAMGDPYLAKAIDAVERELGIEAAVPASERPYEHAVEPGYIGENPAS